MQMGTKLILRFFPDIGQTPSTPIILAFVAGFTTAPPLAVVAGGRRSHLKKTAVRIACEIGGRCSHKNFQHERLRALRRELNVSCNFLSDSSFNHAAELIQSRQE